MGGVSRGVASPAALAVLCPKAPNGKGDPSDALWESYNSNEKESIMTRNSLAIIAFLCVVACFTGCGAGNSANVSIKDILERVKSEVATIESIEMATEETDSNNLLNKPGQYIELGWFVDSRIEKREEFEDHFDADGKPISKGFVAESGTAGGGTIEKFKTASDAKKRDEYLAKFDSMPMLASYHEQHGVFVIRMSNKLTASQQKEIAEKIKKAINN
jgi:hypothetical protein